MSLIYVLTMLLSALLLFLVEPMFARMVLPMLGGSPAVWNTVVVFYQVALLAGYLYAHAATAWLGVRRQAALHLGLLLVPFLVLPVGIPAGSVPPTESNPIPWLLSLMLVRVGLPFVIVSASSPMLQKWFANTTHPSATDPYFMYAASNVGSLVALLAYPLLIEPYLRLGVQSLAWAAGYGLLVVLMLACALLLWRSSKPGGQPASAPDAPADNSTDGLTPGRRLRWVALAFVPSSLMLSVTTYLSTNLTPIPLLWVIPLAIYLLTFVLVFARTAILPRRLLVRAQPIVLLPLVLLMASMVPLPVWLLMAVHLLGFFVLAMVCHGALADDRPTSRHLTEFYLWLSAGGALGGAFNALVAPLIFTAITEYPLGLVLASLVLWQPGAAAQKPHGRWLDLLLPAGLGALMAGLIVGLRAAGVGSTLPFLSLAFGLPAVLCFSFSRRPIRFGLGIAAILLVSGWCFEERPVLYAERTFFGVNRVLVEPSSQYHLLFHGDTLHGMQSLDPARRCEPLSYFYPNGPIGQVFAAFGGAEAKERIAVVGLGAGSLAAYGQPGQQWTFYEIDPGVERIARDPRYFTFLQDCAPELCVVLGDARLSLAGARAGEYELIILDAYSSDAIPVHLITREALALYLDKLAPGGLLAFHISNRYLELRPVVASLVHDAGLAALHQIDRKIDPADEERGKRTSQWVLMARDPADFGPLTADPRWEPLSADPGRAPWTDDFSSIISVVRWH